MMLKQVVLPAPFGPIMARNSASPDRKADLADRAHAAEGLGQTSGPASTLMARLTRLRQSAAKAPTMPCGNASTSSRMMAPSSARQYSVCRITVSCKVANTEAPTIGPVSVWMPPSSTITRPSIERPTWMVSGEIEPLAKANSPPATPQTAPAMAKPSQCTRLTSMPMASARSAESRPARMA